MAPISVTLAHQDPPAAVVALVGEHDTYSSPRLENELLVLLDEGRRIVVDLRDTSFIDSTTLSVLLGARHQAEQSSLGFALVLPDRKYTQVHQIFELTRLGSAFAIFGVPVVQELAGDRADARIALPTPGGYPAPQRVLDQRQDPRRFLMLVFRCRPAGSGAGIYPTSAPGLAG